MSNTPLAQRTSPGHTTVVSVGSARFGSSALPIIAGPCSLESPDQVAAVVSTLVSLGVPCIRGAAFKPRTSPYSFQGHGVEALHWLQSARVEHGLAVVTEVVSPDQIEVVAPLVDCLQVGARNMQNFALLKALGQQPLPVLLKRGLMATVDEWLQAAEYLLHGGNPNVILCERGVRGFDPTTRNLLDVGGIAAIKPLTHLPVIADPSHATGKRHLVLPAARAAVAAGADGLMLEIHPQPDKSVSDAEQALPLEALAPLLAQCQAISVTLGRSLPMAHPCGGG